MTLEDDVRLLREEVERLKAIDREKSRRLEDLESQIGVWNVNGAENLLGGYGFTQVGRKFRFYPTALQVLADESGAATNPLVYFLQDYTPRPQDVEVYARINAVIDTGVPTLILYASNVSGVTAGKGYGSLALTANEASLSAASFLAGPVANTGSISVNTSQTDPYVQLSGAAGASFSIMLYIQARTADPTTFPSNDGEIWSRSDTGKFRGRMGGVIDNFAMEGWVTSTFAPIGGAGLSIGLAVALNTGYGEW